MPTTLKEFETIFPQLVDDLVAHAKAYGVPENGLEWYRQVRSDLTAHN
jgi:farnesyl diphosphate synthase